MRSGSVVVGVALALTAPGCFAPSSGAGAPCDPATPNCPTGQACIAATTGFACLPEGTVPIDGPVPIDSEVIVPECPGDPASLLCFAFDEPVFADPVVNEGVAPVSAALVDVTRISEGRGGAAQLGATSTITIAPNPSLAGIVAAELRFRLDAAVPASGRIGLLDTEGGMAGLSMFLYDTAGITQLRCTLAGFNLYADVTLPIGSWAVVGCTCDNGVIAISLDGVKLAEAPDCSPASATVGGLQIGQNSRALLGLPPNEPLIGAIDFVKLH